jgi:hypothetical protein
VPREKSSGLTENAGGPTKRGESLSREAVFLAADHARRVDPSLGARYQRLTCETWRHHHSALYDVAAVLLTRMVTCLQKGLP